VRWATDVDCGQQIAIKLMRNADQFERELNSRFSLDLSGSVIAVYQ
jgi:hypothetical protein